MTDKKDADAHEEKAPPQDQIIETHHNITIEGQLISYTATAATVILKEEEEEADGQAGKKAVGEKSKATIFFVSYTRDCPEGRSEADYRRERPITFSFNGGPGSSSVWLHLGLLGPRRVPVAASDNSPLPPPHRLVDNTFSLLDVTDLVFIDPVSTGYSRVVPGEKPSEFHGFKKDIESVGEFIRLYTTRYKRWTSPKFIIGESYGTTRAAGLSGFLQSRHGMYLNGVMLVSTILNFQTARFSPGNDLPYILFLPTYTATAWYHQRLSADLQKDLGETLVQVEAFALGEYASALLKGASLPADERRMITQQLSRYSGLSLEYIEQTNLRIDIHRFVKELLRDQRTTVGRLDSRFTGVDRDAAGEHYEYDPSYAVIQGPYTAALNDYVRTELSFETDLPYEILTDRVRPWRFDEHENQFVNVAETLRESMSKNPHLRVFVASGYFDLATPHFATKYTFDHLQLAPGLRHNLTMRTYEAGHMMYVHDPSLAQLKKDLSEFVTSASLP